MIESGLGGKADNFDTLAVHTFPQSRCVEELWRDASPEEIAADQEHWTRAARRSAAYAGIGHDECGRFQLAGKSIAVPFVGTAAASFVLAEAIRLFHRGPACNAVKLRMATPAHPPRVVSERTYVDSDTEWILYSWASKARF